MDAAYAGSKPEGVHRSITDQTLRLRKDEAQELTDDLVTVLNAWVSRTRGRDPRRRTYSYLSLLQPLPEPDSDGTTS